MVYKRILTLGFKYSIKRQMKKIIFFLILLPIFFFTSDPSQEDYLKIAANVVPERVRQGEEGTLKIKITPKDGIKISSHPEFIIKLDDNNSLTFSKIFFTASEMDFQTIQEKEVILLDLEKEIEIPFKLKENSLIGKHKISGEVIFTAVFKDNWSLKTYQKFIAQFRASRNSNIKKK